MHVRRNPRFELCLDAVTVSTASLDNRQRKRWTARLTSPPSTQRTNKRSVPVVAACARWSPLNFPLGSATQGAVVHVVDPNASTEQKVASLGNASDALHPINKLTPQAKGIYPSYASLLCLSTDQVRNSHRYRRQQGPSTCTYHHHKRCRRGQQGGQARSYQRLCPALSIRPHPSGDTHRPTCSWRPSRRSCPCHTRLVQGRLACSDRHRRRSPHQRRGGQIGS